MKFIIATHSYLLLCTVGGGWQVKELEILNEGHHYGIALTESEIISKQNDHYLTVYPRSNNSEQVRTIQLAEGYEHIHQIVHANEGIYLTNTRRNSIAFRSNSNEVQQYVFNACNTDVNHVNSLFVMAPYVLALLHNHGRRLSLVAILSHRLSRGFRLQRTVPLWDSGCHNLHVADNRLCYNASSTGDFVIVDLRTNDVLKRLSFSGHTKGLAVTENYYVIGVSQFATRAQRKFVPGFLVLIDRDSLEVAATIDLNIPTLPQPVGNINEIRCLSAPDYSQSGNEVVDWESIELIRKNPVRYWLTILRMQLRRLDARFSRESSLAVRGSYER